MPVKISITSTPVPNIRTIIKGLTPAELLPLVRSTTRTITSRLAEATPVNQNPNAVAGRTLNSTVRGRLQSSWRSLVRKTEEGAAATVYNTDPRAKKGLIKLLVGGSRAHIIKPKFRRALAFRDGSQKVVARWARHPGTSPNFGFEGAIKAIVSEEGARLRAAIRANIAAKNK